MTAPPDVVRRRVGPYTKSRHSKRLHRTTAQRKNTPAIELSTHFSKFCPAVLPGLAAASPDIHFKAAKGPGRHIGSLVKQAKVQCQCSTRVRRSQLKDEACREEWRVELNREMCRLSFRQDKRFKAQLVCCETHHRAMRGSLAKPTGPT